jgi:MFS family permease
MLAMVLANIAGQMSPLLMPIYLTQMGASIGQVGLVFTLTSVVILVLQIMGGWISDSIGRLRAIAIGSVGGVLGFAALVMLAPVWLKFKAPKKPVELLAADDSGPGLEATEPEPEVIT